MKELALFHEFVSNWGRTSNIRMQNSLTSKNNTAPKSTGFGTGTTFGKASAAAPIPYLELKITEDYKIDDKQSITITAIDQKEHSANDYLSEYFKGTYFYQNVFKTKMTRLEGIDLFDKQMKEIEGDIQRSIDHTLNILSNEIEHGRSVLEDAREQLDQLRNFKESPKRHVFPSPFFQQFVKDLDKKAEDVKDSIQSFERSLHQSNEKQTTASLINLIRTQHNTIIRSSAKLSRVQKNLEPLREQVMRIMEDRGKDTDILSSRANDSNVNDTNRLDVIEEYNKFLDGRKRNLEKRTPLTEAQLKEKCAKPAAGAKKGFGTTFGKTAQSKPATSTQGTKQ